MKRKLLTILLLLVCVFVLLACNEAGPQGEQGPQGEKGDDGEDGQTPHIGDNGNWWIGDTDTGIFAGESNKTADFIYQINEEGTGYIIKGMNSVYSNDIVIPSQYNGFPVVGIDNCQSKYIKTVTIPDSVTSIGGAAFSGCSSLTSITIPDSVTSIGSSAFSACSSLTSITIPDSVTSIGGAAFSGCSSLTSITIPDSVTSIGNSAFYNCPIEKATIPAIACSYINNSKLKEVVITSGNSIGEDAFSYCDSLTSITIPDSVTSIGGYAFNRDRDTTKNQNKIENSLQMTA